MEIVRLSIEDCELLEARFLEYGNSHLRYLEALSAPNSPDSSGNEGGAEAGEGGAPGQGADGREISARLSAIRRLESHFSIDLGSLYYRFQHRGDRELHPLERGVLDSIAYWHRDPDGRPELWVLIDNVQKVRALIDDERAEWLEPVEKC